MKMQSLSAEDYHWSTSHIRNHISPPTLDFNNYPLPFKPYEIQNPVDLIVPPALADRVIDQIDISFETLSAILYLSHGVTASKGSGPIPFLSRTIPSAGGLYPCHLYVGIQSRNMGETGVFYYDPPHGRLIRVRKGNNCERDGFPMGLSLDLKNGDTLFFMITASLYNSAWKYRNRAFRYLLLDSGHLAENLSLVLGHCGMDHQLFYDFDDQRAADFLGIDLSREVPMVCVTTGWNKTVSDVMDILGNTTIPCFPGLTTSQAEADVLASHEVLQDAYTAGMPVKETQIFSTGKPLGNDPNPIRLILARRSRRNFVTDLVPKEVHKALFLRLSSVWQGMFLPDEIKFRGEVQHLFTLGMIAQNLEGLDDGFYMFSRDGARIHLMDRGGFAPLLAHVCLDQQWIGQAAINFLFMADIQSLDQVFGPRGYRYTMFNAGRVAQQIYLGAEALELGCCGIGAIYDLEAKELLDLTQEEALIYAVAVGPVKKRTQTGV